MKNVFFRLALFAVLAHGAALAGAAQGNKIEWHKDFEAARAAAKRTGKPMLIDFTAEWCPPCKEMERSFWPKKEVVALADKFVWVSLNFDVRREERSRYQVDTIPAVIFTDPWGNLLTQKRGYGPTAAAALVEYMRAIPGDFTPVGEWAAALEKNRDSPAALARFGEFYGRHGVLDLSSDYYKRALKAKEPEADPKTRGEVVIALGINYLRMKDYDDARKTFESYLKETPDGPRADTAFLGIITAQINRKKLADAEKTFEQLKAAHPGSPLVAQAERLLQQGREMKK